MIIKEKHSAIRLFNKAEKLCTSKMWEILLKICTRLF